MGLTAEEATALGQDAANRIRAFRLILLLAQELRMVMDQFLREDGLTTRQATLITVIDSLGEPSIKQAADALGTTHQNVKQLASSLQRKQFIRIVHDPSDRRIRRLVTTDKSRTTWQRRGTRDQQRVLEWFAELSDKEARTLFDLLLKTEASVRTATDAAHVRTGVPSGGAPARSLAATRPA